jgi:NAD(P)-dependent dehydrogenase (short-subunit alcohol dehydrogenase family)
MSKTVLITGASSGIGKATAQYFASLGWNVVATARSENIHGLEQSDRLLCLRLDVTNESTIQEAITKALDRFGKIDVLVNNAGYGLLGAFEATTTEQVQRQFATNVFGLFDVTRVLIPHFRSQQAGTIINISSMGGHMSFPFASLYHATKWAVEGFSESLQYELEPFGIRVKVIEPGVVRTGYADRLEIASKPELSIYDAPIKSMMQKSEQGYEGATKPEVVAKVIYRAATDNSKRLRYAAGSPLLFIRKLLPDNIFFAMIRQVALR